MTKATIETGNAKTDCTGTGCFVGHFMEKGTLAHTKDVEVKWGRTRKVTNERNGRKPKNDPRSWCSSVDGS